MSAPVIAFFNNKGGVRTTSLAYHLAWMMAGKGLRVVAADLDPQANLTANFLEETELEGLWPAENTLTTPGRTIFGSLAPLVRGVEDIADPMLVDVSDRLSLLPGDLALSTFEEEFSDQWRGCLDRQERAFRVTSAFWRLLSRASEQREADVVLVDVGPTFGSLSRAALVAADHVVIPLLPDILSVQGLQSLGPTLRSWRSDWRMRRERNPDPALELPPGDMRPVGYVLFRYDAGLGRSVKAYQQSMERIPVVYRTAVLDIVEPPPPPPANADPHCLAQLRHYRTLKPLSYEARKPIFALKPADGAFGGHQAAVTEARADFAALADRIMGEVGVTIPDSN